MVAEVGNVWSEMIQRALFYDQLPSDGSVL